MISQRVTSSKQCGGLGEQVIVVLRTRIDERGRDARGVFSGGLDQALASRLARSGICFENLRGPDERHEPDGDLLAVHPVRAEVGRIAIRKLLEIFPESFGVFVILREAISATQCECPAEAGGLPDEFDIMNR